MASRKSSWLRRGVFACLAAGALQASVATAQTLAEYESRHQNVSDPAVRTRIARAHMAADKAFPGSKPKVEVLINAYKRSLTEPTVLIDVAELQNAGGQWGPGTGTRTITEMILRELNAGGQTDRVTVPEGERTFASLTPQVEAAERSYVKEKFRVMIFDEAQRAAPVDVLNADEIAKRREFWEKGLGNFDGKAPRPSGGSAAPVSLPRLSVVQLTAQRTPPPLPTMPVVDRSLVVSTYINAFIPEQARPGVIGRVLDAVFGQDSRLARWWNEGKGEHTAFSRIDARAYATYEAASCAPK